MGCHAVGRAALAGPVAKGLLRVRSLPGTVVLLPLLLSSCFTAMLWGFAPEDEVDAWTGKEETVFTYQAETKWSWGLLGLRVLLTPLTLCLDCVTAPVQCWLNGDDDDCHHHKHHRCHH